MLRHHVRHFWNFGDPPQLLNSLVGIAPQLLQLCAPRDQGREGFGEDVLIEVGSEYLSIGNMDTVVVQVHGTAVVDVHVGGDADEEDEEGGDKDGNVVLFLEEEAGERDTDVVGTGAIGVAILLEVFPGLFFGQNLTATLIRVNYLDWLNLPCMLWSIG